MKGIFKNKKLFKIIIVCFVIFLSLGIVGFLSKDKYSKNNSNSNNNSSNNSNEIQIPEDAVKMDVPVVEIEGLTKKLESLKFEDITYFQVDKNENKRGNKSLIQFVNGYLSGQLYSYEYDKPIASTDINNVKSLGLVDNGFGSTAYLLLDNGKVMELIYIDKLVNSPEGFDPDKYILDLVPISAMAIAKNDFTLNEYGSKKVNKVFLKTTDGRILTNDRVTNDDKKIEFVEVVEKKK